MKVYEAKVTTLGHRLGLQPADPLLDFIRVMLIIDPDERPTCSQLLHHQTYVSPMGSNGKRRLTSSEFHMYLRASRARAQCTRR